jgi:hypothetical protein
MRLLRLWEWLTFMPKVTPLSQNSHFAICCTSSLVSNSENNNNRTESEMQVFFVRQKTCKNR